MVLTSLMRFRTAEIGLGSAITAQNAMPIFHPVSHSTALNADAG